MDQFNISYLENSSKIYTQGIITDISHLGTEGLPTFHIIRNSKVIFKYSPTAEQIIKESKLPLSKTEFQLLQLIARGVFSKDIAKELNISISTFYTHRRNIRDKMNLEINSVIALLRQKGYL